MAGLGHPWRIHEFGGRICPWPAVCCTDVGTEGAGAETGGELDTIGGGLTCCMCCGATGTCCCCGTCDRRQLLSNLNCPNTNLPKSNDSSTYLLHITCGMWWHVSHVHVIWHRPHRRLYHVLMGCWLWLVDITHHWFFIYHRLRRRRCRSWCHRGWGKRILRWISAILRSTGIIIVAIAAVHTFIFTSPFRY